VEDGRLLVPQDPGATKVVTRVAHVTFNGARAFERGQTVHYITERCVFRLVRSGLELIEIAPGVDLQSDVLDLLQFRPAVADEVRIMDPAIFGDPLMGLAKRSPVSLKDRVVHDPAENIAYVNFEGLSIQTLDDAAALADFLDKRYAEIGQRFNIVVNYDNFSLGTDAIEAFFTMVRHNEERYFLSSTRYSTNAFFRRQMGTQFEEANLRHQIYANFSEAQSSGLEGR
jgi:propionate CoA-transferase